MIATAEHPLIFSPTMVRAQLADAKTQTRRVLKPTAFLPASALGITLRWECENGIWYPHRQVKGLRVKGIRCPYGQAGENLWVRENWAVGRVYDATRPRDIDPGAKVAYPASGGCTGLRIRPSIHMPRWASRITLEITRIRVERLQDITHEDIAAEGALWALNEGSYKDNCAWASERARNIGRGFGWGAWAVRWDLINADRGYGWHRNPWVWVIEFRRLM